jgi:periplasmic protein TonB
MPRTFFDQVLVTETPRRGSKWMKALSLAFHVAIVLALLVLPITAAFDLPGVYTALPPVMLASVTPPPVPPAPAPPPTVAPVPVAVQTVPLVAPDGVREELPTPPPAAPPSPLGTPGGIGSVPNVGVSINNSTLSIPKPPEEPQGPRRVGGDIKPPERTTYRAPQYPAAAQAAKIEGTVVLEAIIDAQGVVQNVRVIKSVPLLDRAAIEAVQQWRYNPTRLNGVAIPVIMSVTVMFTLK